jgi:probable phosphoglycerate mutase
LTILLVRHGETEWNLEGRYQGRFDSPLTRRGIAQAQAVGRLIGELAGAQPVPIVASPLGRARRTAEIIAACSGNPRSVTFDERLREISLGSWDGLTRGEIARRSPGIFAGSGRREWYFRSPDGETYESFAARLGDWLDDRNSAELVVAVAHGVASRVLRGLYAGLAREIALALPVPQDRMFRLSAGVIDEIAIPVGITG